MLLETTVGTAAIVAERIRARVAIEEFPGGGSRSASAWRNVQAMATRRSR